MRQKDIGKVTNARDAGVLLFCTGLLLLTGCATGPPLPSTSDMRVTESAYIDSVPFHPQSDYQCGPAALAMALNASNVDVSVDDLIPQVFLPEREGSVQLEMQAVVRRYNRISYVLDGSTQSLIQELDAGNPVIVMQNLALSFWPIWHYAVVIGYDLHQSRITLHSGKEADRPMRFRRFDATWARSDRWAMVVLPPGKLPASTNPGNAIEAIVAFERANNAYDALPAWRSVVERWPKSAMGWLALGNAKHACGQIEKALFAFENATEQDPNLAAAWMNLGLTLKAIGQYDDARHALRMALSLPNPWHDRIKEALELLTEEP